MKGLKLLANLVISPQRSNLILTTNIPNSEIKFLASTLKPIVGIIVTTSPNFNLRKVIALRRKIKKELKNISVVKIHTKITTFKSFAWSLQFCWVFCCCPSLTAFQKLCCQKIFLDYKKS